jgi:hypothetical protein
MTQEKNLNYEQVIKLGFKRFDDEDRVFERRHGYKYFYMQKTFPNKLSVDWDIETHELKLFKNWNGVRKISTSELLFLIEIFKKSNK